MELGRIASGSGFRVLGSGFTVRELILAGFHFEIHYPHRLCGLTPSRIAHAGEQLGNRIVGLHANGAALGDQERRVCPEPQHRGFQWAPLVLPMRIDAIPGSEGSFKANRGVGRPPGITGAPGQSADKRPAKQEHEGTHLHQRLTV